MDLTPETGYPKVFLGCIDRGRNMSELTISATIRSTSGNPLTVTIAGPNTNVVALMQDLSQAVQMVRTNINAQSLTHIPPLP
jgi:hypothetical protein